MRSIKDRRQYYNRLEKKGFTPEEVVRLMSDEELQMNYNKGGKLAIKEFEKRKSIANLQPMPFDPDLDLGC